MSSIKPLKLAVTAALLASSSTVLAIPFGSFDSRSMAMGGAGVAVGGADAAPLFNPALLSVTKAEDDFAIVFPTVGIRVADPDNLRDSINAFQDGNYVDNLQADITALDNAINATVPNQTTIQTAAATVGGDITTVSNQLATLSNKPITADVGLATVVAVPSKKFGAAFYANGTVTAGGLFQYNDADTLTNPTTGLSTLATQCATDAVANAAACNTLSNFNTDNLTSGIHLKGVQLTEIGIALSSEFQISEHNLAFGITPKIVKAKLFDTVVLVNDSNQSITPENNTAEYTNFNFDLGAAKEYSNGWRTGFVVKNVIPQNLDFKINQVSTGESLSLKPQARIGVSHANTWSTVALDVDLTRNNPAGLENASQYVALGGELDAWGWAQVRAGYRVDMVDSNRSVASVGLGFAPFEVVHIDFAYAGNANEFGASFQLGVHF